MRGREEEALTVLSALGGEERATGVLREIHENLAGRDRAGAARWRSLLSPSLRLVLAVGLIVAVLQQVTGINAVFFYAPMIFEQSGIGTDAAFMQAVLVGLTNVAFTVVALLVIDRLGRRPLLLVGVGCIAICMGALAWGFDSATYTLQAADLASLPAGIDTAALAPLTGVTYDSDLAYRAAIVGALGPEALRSHEGALISAAISVQPGLILVAILGFVASFAVSLGPVMWVLFSELFPNRIRGIAISVCGLVNSGVSFSVQFLFPWSLANLGNASTFMAFGAFAVIGLGLLFRLLPETKGYSLEALEARLVRG
jgi:MFS family permease